jgi:UDP-N-acetylglucosamine:LPS N-acetylglucosamine transferase
LLQNYKKILIYAKKVVTLRTFSIMKRVLVTYIEAGFGHISTANSIADAIEELHDPNIEVVRKYMFKDDPRLRKLEKNFIRDVKWANTFPWHNYIQMALTHIGGIHESLPLVVSTLYRHTRQKYLEILEEIKPDIIIDTHYLTSFLATQYRDMIDPHVKVVTYDPDNSVHNWWNIRVDKFVVNCRLAFHDALEHDFTRKQLMIVPFVTRKEIMDVTEDKVYYRKQFDLPQDRFTVMVAAGGYGKSGMQRVVNALMTVKHPITVIAICGTNQRLYKRLLRLKKIVAPRIDLRPYEFVPKVYELNRAADVLITKGGPNAMLDSALMGVPIGVFYCASDIEYQSMHLFTAILNCGRFFKRSHKIVRWVNECVENPSILEIYKEAADEVRREGNGAVNIAKFIQTYEA